ncbi:hypothetical protein HAX54_009448 [Datura stramonium]|uniref:Uncharacterized protein n=1 Tax=Datura stramonium TaxID=4076 RepID=A0ABS8TGE1_DATST|nr:hypothetical protein [Datura stramonium]
MCGCCCHTKGNCYKLIGYLADWNQRRKTSYGNGNPNYNARRHGNQGYGNYDTHGGQHNSSNQSSFSSAINTFGGHGDQNGSETLDLPLSADMLSPVDQHKDTTVSQNVTVLVKPDSLQPIEPLRGTSRMLKLPIWMKDYIDPERGQGSRYPLANYLSYDSTTPVYCLERD